MKPSQLLPDDDITFKLVAAIAKTVVYNNTLLQLCLVKLSKIEIGYDESEESKTKMLALLNEIEQDSKELYQMQWNNVFSNLVQFDKDFLKKFGIDPDNTNLKTD